jgi:hypothetical protein
MWRLRFDSSLTAWAVVPRPDEHERRREWGRVVVGALRKQWEIDQDGPFSDALVQTTEALLSSQPKGALTDLATWPIRSPLPLRVTFYVLDAATSTDWEAQGMEASPYLQSPFGEGVQYSRRIPSEITQGVASIEAVIVFDRGDAALVVQVHACPIEVYVASASILADLIASCGLTDSTGRPFTTGRNEYLVPDDSDAWPDRGVGVRG